MFYAGSSAKGVSTVTVDVDCVSTEYKKCNIYMCVCMYFDTLQDSLTSDLFSETCPHFYVSVSETTG